MHLPKLTFIGARNAATIDLNATVDWLSNPRGVNPDLLAPRTGVTTWVDAGSVGPLSHTWHEEALAELLSARLAAVGHPRALTVALRHGGPRGGAGQQPWTPPPPGPAAGQRQNYGPMPKNLPPQSWPHG